MLLLCNVSEHWDPDEGSPPYSEEYEQGQKAVILRRAPDLVSLSKLLRQYGEGTGRRRWDW